MNTISTHVHDQVNGHPAAGMNIALRRFGTVRNILITTATTNQEGRTDKPLLASNVLITGVYELEFEVGVYFVSNGIACPFLTTVVIRFNVFDGGQSYHLPLFVTPWEYRTYRGS